MRPTTFSDVLGRGVYVAPWVGPNGETVLFAIDRHHRLLGEPTLNGVGAADALWDRLDQADPIPALKIV